MSNGLPGCWAAGFRGGFPAAPRWQPGSGAGPAHVWVRAPLPSPQGCSPWAVAGLLLWAFCAFPSCGALHVLLWARRPRGAVCWADCWGCGVGLGAGAQCLLGLAFGGGGALCSAGFLCGATARGTVCPDCPLSSAPLTRGLRLRLLPGAGQRHSSIHALRCKVD